MFFVFALDRSIAHSYNKPIKFICFIYKDFFHVEMYWKTLMLMQILLV